MLGNLDGGLRAPQLQSQWLSQGTNLALKSCIECEEEDSVTPSNDSSGPPSDPMPRAIVSMRPRPDPVRPGQESVWDYPRPPRLQARGPHPRRVRRPGHRRDDRRLPCPRDEPPARLLPAPWRIVAGALVRTHRRSFCEWKGEAHYFGVQAAERVEPDAAWGYDVPSAGFDAIAGYVAFYAGRMDACWVGDELLPSQAASTAGGSRPTWAARSRVSRAARAGRYQVRSTTSTCHSSGAALRLWPTVAAPCTQLPVDDTACMDRGRIGEKVLPSRQTSSSARKRACSQSRRAAKLRHIP